MCDCYVVLCHLVGRGSRRVVIMFIVMQLLSRFKLVQQVGGSSIGLVSIGCVGTFICGDTDRIVSFSVYGWYAFV